MEGRASKKIWHSQLSGRRSTTCRVSVLLPWVLSPDSRPVPVGRCFSTERVQTPGGASVVVRQKSHWALTVFGTPTNPGTVPIRRATNDPDAIPCPTPQGEVFGGVNPSISPAWGPNCFPRPPIVFPPANTNIEPPNTRLSARYSINLAPRRQNHPPPPRYPLSDCAQ